MNLDPFLDIAQRTRPFLARSGRAFATVAAGAGCQSLPIRSRAFRQWFYAQSYGCLNTIPSAPTFAAILHHLDAQAARDPFNCNIPVPFRIGAGESGHIVLDLASGEFVEITPSGWHMRSSSGFPFQTSPSTVALPTPQTPEGDPLDSLRVTLNLGPSDGPAWLRTLAWLLSAMRPSGPYPVLLLRGPSGSGKSFAALVLRTLIDPCGCAFIPLPVTVRQLLTFARQNWILAFDHVDSLTPTVTSALCRLCSGAGAPCREPGQPEPLQLWTRRPILITAAPGWNPPPHLAARTLTADLPPLTNPRPQAQLSTAINDAIPQLLGALCDAVSRSLATPTDPASAGIVHHADTLAVAQAAFPDRADAFHHALRTPAPTDGPLIESLRTLLSESPRWTGTATDLLRLLPLAPNPRALSAKLHKSLLPLAEAGIDVRFPRLSGGTRAIELFASQNPQ
jgi:hypothetical protein